MSSVTSALTFGGSHYYHDRLDDIFCDNTVSVYQWRPFMSESSDEWKRSAFLVSPNDASVIAISGF
jgi:hypothetical protein